jgi:hypothetical protein
MVIVNRVTVNQGELAMKPRAYRRTAFTLTVILALAYPLLLGCKGKNDPIKPTVAQPAVVAAHAAIR